jgi:Ca-activated chloride channel homolog
MRRILFMVAPVLLLMFAFHPVNSFTVTGKVTDAEGNPINRASVFVKGTNTGVMTSMDGSYSITVADLSSTLVFSYVGYKTFEVKVNSKPLVDGKTVIDVSLLPSGGELSEVVVIGYATMRKKDMTGSVATTVPGGAPVSFGSTPLAGKVAGLDVKGGRRSARKVKGRGVSGANRKDALCPAFGNVPADKKEDFNTEAYDNITENKFLRVADNPLSTFSIDVDAASYSNVRRFINEGQLPPAGAVRIEEMINYFKYDYPQPEANQPFSINTEISDAPWNKDHKLVLIGLQGKKIPVQNLPAANLVFLIDVSGSMTDPNKLPLVKASMKLLTDQLRQGDKVAMVVYAGSAGLVLPPTDGTEKIKIKDAIERLEAGGSTAGGEGIRLAYKTAKENFVQGGNNRVILCTDGDFNIGESSDDAMERLIEEERKSGVFLTVLGYGMGNYKDSKMQKLADKGNGNHAYIDGINEAKKVLVNEFGGTLFTIAKDVKLQIEFNPANVQGYRLIGYENRMLAKEDFNDDKKDAGELGSGHTVTALYEVIPAGIKDSFLTNADRLKYQKNVTERTSKSSYSNELMTVKFRYKKPDEDKSKLIEHAVIDKQIPLTGTSDNFRFAAAVAEFGMLLRNSTFKANASFDNAAALAKNAQGGDEEGYRAEFIRMLNNADKLATNNKKQSATEAVASIQPEEKH